MSSATTLSYPDLVRLIPGFDIEARLYHLAETTTPSAGSPFTVIVYGVISTLLPIKPSELSHFAKSGKELCKADLKAGLGEVSAVLLDKICSRSIICTYLSNFVPRLTEMIPDEGLRTIVFFALRDLGTLIRPDILNILGSLLRQLFKDVDNAITLSTTASTNDASSTLLPVPAPIDGPTPASALSTSPAQAPADGLNLASAPAPASAGATTAAQAQVVSTYVEVPAHGSASSRTAARRSSRINRNQSLIEETSLSALTDTALPREKRMEEDSASVLAKCPELDSNSNAGQAKRTRTAGLSKDSAAPPSLSVPARKRSSNDGPAKALKLPKKSLAIGPVLTDITNVARRVLPSRQISDAKIDALLVAIIESSSALEPTRTKIADSRLEALYKHRAREVMSEEGELGWKRDFKGFANAEEGGKKSLMGRALLRCGSSVVVNAFVQRFMDELKPYSSDSFAADKLFYVLVDEGIITYRFKIGYFRPLCWQLIERVNRERNAQMNNQQIEQNTTRAKRKTATDATTNPRPVKSLKAAASSSVAGPASNEVTSENGGRILRSQSKRRVDRN